MDELRVVTRKERTGLIPSEKKSEIESTNISLSALNNSNNYSPDFFRCELFKTIKAHDSDIMALHIFKNKIYSASTDKTIKIWDLESGKLLNTLTGHNGSVHTLAIHDDKLFSGASDKTIKIWDLNTEKLICTILAHNNQIYSIIGYQDKFISSSIDKTIKIWDISTKRILIQINLESSAWTLSAIGNKLIAGLGDGTIKIFDINSGSLILSCQEHEDSITSVFSDGKIIVSASKDKSIKIWNLENLNLLDEIKIHNAPVWSVILDKEKIISGSDDKTVKIWDYQRKYLLDSLVGNSDWISSIANANSRIIAGTGDGVIKIWLKRPKNNCENIDLNFESIEKSPFETDREFLEKVDTHNKKINSILIGYDYIQIGKAQLLADNYSFEKEILPLKISINCEKIAKLSKIENSFVSSIVLNRFEAEKLFKSSALHDLYIKYFMGNNQLNYQLCLIFIDNKYILDMTVKLPEITKKTGLVKSDRLSILPATTDRPKEFYHETPKHDCSSIDISDTFRSPFEAQNDFEHRVKTKLLSYQEINIGKVNLIAEEFNIEGEVFPLKANISCDKIINLINIKKEFSSNLKIDRYRARDLYETSKTHNLYINFIEKGNTLFYRLSIISNEVKYFLIENQS